jgi:probable rRNA maturation factor
MIANLQTKVPVQLAGARVFVRGISAALGLKGQWFNVCFVDDSHIRRLNEEFRGKPRPTDVLSFPWQDRGPCRLGAASPRKDQEGGWEDEFAGFLGDIVISAETAWRNAAAAGHSTWNEIRWLILHGTLHLLGYDHATGDGEMTALELSLRGRLGIEDPKSKSKSKGQKAKMQKAQLHSRLREGSWRKEGADAD